MDPNIVQLAAGRVDWGLFLQMVVQERAEAIVSARLGRLGVKLPDEEQRALKSMATRSDLRMATLSHRLDQTLAALAAAGIPVLLLKGAALGRTVYGSLPRRPMLDLDLLIPEDRCHQAREVALATEWVTGKYEELTEFYAGHSHMPPLHDGRGGLFNLELHSALFARGHPFDWPLEQLWQRSRPLPEGPGRVPSPEDLLLHTALHFSWSHAARVGAWRAFRDVCVLAESGSIDWPRFTALACATRAGPAAYWALRLARTCSGVEVPYKVEGSLRPSLPGLLVPLLERHLASRWFPADAPCPSLRLDRSLWRLSMRPLAHSDAPSPWERDPILQEAVAPTVDEPVYWKLIRHTGSLARYWRYFRRVALGRA